MTYAMKIQEAHAKGKAEGRNEGIREGMLKAVSMLKKLKISKDAAVHEIMNTYSLTDEEAKALVNNNW